MEKLLVNMKSGESGTVEKLGVGAGPFRRRLLDMGITPGARVTFKKVAPLGDPVEIALRGYELSLRRKEAAAISVRVGGGV